MKSKTLILLILFFVISIVTILYLVIPDIDNEKFDTIEIKSENAKPSIYIKRKVWGLTGDNQTIVISNSNKNDFESNLQSDYVYLGLSPFYYRVSNDSLFIYTMEKSKVPRDFKNGIKIIQISLPNTEMMHLIYNDEYKKEGLKTF